MITPINPHTISNRPIVLMPREKIEVQYLSDYEPVEITYDGFSRHALAPNEVFRILPAKRTFKMVSLSRSDYFSTLRTKLNWTGQLRYGELNHRTEDRD
ncbi:MAG: NAD kinase [Chlamydiales bacterium]|nr:NAD kinase [Chlamydiales bacterium]